MKPNFFTDLRSALPKGYRERIQTETQFSMPYIDKVMKGTRYNQQIIDTALAILEETQTAKKASIGKIKKLLDEEV